MPDDAFGEALRESVAGALEEMFFVTDLEECDPAVRPPAPELTVRVDFEGAPSGWLSLRAGIASARSLAADFLGEDEDSIGDRQVTDVFSELANIVCGAVLTRTESACIFHLSSPRVVDCEPALDLVEDTKSLAAALPAGSKYAVALPHGPLAVFLKTEGAECGPSGESAS